MENNKAYLQKIPWVALIALLHTLVIFVFIPLLFDSYRSYSEAVSTSYEIRLILYSILPISFFAALGIVTSNWKAAGIAAGLYVVIQVFYWFILKKMSSTSDIGSFFKQQLVMFFIYPLPTLLFAAIHTGFTKKLWLVVPIIFLFSMGFSLDTTAINGRNLLSIVDDFEFRDGWGIMITIFSILVRTAFYVGEIIVICEVMNIGFGKTYTNKPTLMNLGNDYSNKASNIFTFWSIKLCLFVVILASAASFAGIMLSTSNDRYSFSDVGDTKLYFLFTSILRLLSYTGLAIFLAWYTRKFLLEIFVNYGIHSKFLYWFCFLPILGFFGFLVVQLENIKQDKYSQKLNSIGTFAASSTAGVTGVIFFLMGIRLIIELADGNAAFIVSAILGAGLFVWMISSKTGYQVSTWLAGAALFILLVLGLTTKGNGYREQEVYSILFALLLANLVSLVFIYPVYHFEEFQYMPSEDPDPAIQPGDPEFTLFP